MAESQADHSPPPAGLRLVGAARLTPAEFGSLFEAASRKLWCVAAAVLGDRSRASDVVQEAAVIALGKLHEFDPATNFAAWMGQIVRYTALNEGRKRQRAGGTLADPSVLDASNSREISGSGVGVSGRAAIVDPEREFDDHVCAALRALDETARSCLLMKTVLDLPYAEIALMLGIPEGTAMSHVHRARKSMRERLSSSEHAVSPKGGGA